VPRTVLINPVITPIGEEEQLDWEGCLSVPGLRAMVPRWNKVRYTGFDIYGDPIDRTVEAFTRAWSSMSATTSGASSIR
jgi:peptide deformylase